MIENISALEKLQQNQGEIVPNFHHKPMVETVNV